MRTSWRVYRCVLHLVCWLLLGATGKTNPPNLSLQGDRDRQRRAQDWAPVNRSRSPSLPARPFELTALAVDWADSRSPRSLVGAIKRWLPTRGRIEEGDRRGSKELRDLRATVGQRASQQQPFRSCLLAGDLSSTLSGAIDVLSVSRCANLGTATSSGVATQSDLRCRSG